MVSAVVLQESAVMREKVLLCQELLLCLKMCFKTYFINHCENCYFAFVSNLSCFEVIISVYQVLGILLFSKDDFNRRGN